MFKALCQLIKDSGLCGIEFNIKPIGQSDALSVMLSFHQAGEFEHKLLQKFDDAGATANADQVMALRAALNTPVAIIGEPDELMSKVEQALSNLREGVISASTAYSALDISALLAKATTQAKSSKPAEKAKPKTEKTKPAAVTVPEQSADDANDTDSEAVVAEQAASDTKAPTKQAEKSEVPSEKGFVGFDAFDSL